MSATDQTPLKNKVAVITGASSGIGSATAQELDAAGMKLVLVARSEKKLLDVQSKLTSASILPLDVTQDGAAEKAIEFAQQTYGDLDVLVNNAG
ncbi:MAG: SDR family NAD(P)-dependent oxidoreductase, partial [Myxococcota bacterium]